MNPHTEFERFTQLVYQKLVDNDILIPIKVRHNEKMTGKSGCEHQIDVYWEYEVAGNIHRMAIECKNYDSPVPIGKVRDFFGVLHDLNNVQGIMVSSKGFQEGAKKFASFYGISLKELRRPDSSEIIGTISTVVHCNSRPALYRIDDEWVKEHNIDLDNLRRFYANFQLDKAEYWKTAKHLPLETTDNFIRDAQGVIISSLEELEQQLPENPDPGTETIIPFEDGWVESRYWGPVRIREVKFENESKVQETDCGPCS